jgi:YgiT-type zinc finger domain-containing protein
VKCRVCGGAMDESVTDLPFKIGDTSIVIVRSLPVLQCAVSAGHPSWKTSRCRWSTSSSLWWTAPRSWKWSVTLLDLSRIPSR